MRKGRLLQLLLALAAATLLAGLAPVALAQNAPPKSLTVLTNHTFIGKYAPLFVARAKGYYRDAGFEIRILPTSGSGFVISAIDVGKADYGIADVGPVVQAIAKGSRVQGMFVYQNRSAVALASLRPVPDLEALRGKKIAASQADSARVALAIVLGRNHLADLPFEWVAADPNVYFSLLLDDRVDLVSSSVDGDVPALRKIAEPRGKKVFYLSLYDWGYRMYGLWLIGNRVALQADPAAARRFFDATQKGMLYSIAHPEEAARILVQDNPVLNYDTIVGQWRASIQAMGRDPTQGGQYGWATTAGLRDTVEIVSQALNLDAAHLAPAAVFDAGFTRN